MFSIVDYIYWLQYSTSTKINGSNVKRFCSVLWFSAHHCCKKLAALFYSYQIHMPTIQFEVKEIPV